MTNSVRASDVATQVRVPKAAELVAAQLRGQIVRGVLGEGDALPPEHELMQRFGVSRPTLREALRVLEGESLLSIQRGARGGARIHTPDGDAAARYAGLALQFRGATVADVYRARTALDLASLRMILQRSGDADLTALRENVAAMNATYRRPWSSNFAMGCAALWSKPAGSGIADRVHVLPPSFEADTAMPPYPLLISE